MFHFVCALLTIKERGRAKCVSIQFKVWIGPTPSLLFKDLQILQTKLALDSILITLMFSEHFCGEHTRVLWVNLFSQRSMDGISFRPFHKEPWLTKYSLSKESELLTYALSHWWGVIFQNKETHQGQSQHDDDENDGFWSYGIYAGNPRSFIRSFHLIKEFLFSQFLESEETKRRRRDSPGRNCRSKRDSGTF